LQLPTFNFSCQFPTGFQAERTPYIALV
jgi:hypothetical protein